MFNPQTKRKLTPLERKWEQRLKSEGLGEIRPLTDSGDSDGLRVVPLMSKYSTEDHEWAFDQNLDLGAVDPAGNPAPMQLAATATARYWTLFSQAVQALDRDYAKRDRLFLERLAETGSIEQAQRKLAKYTCYAILRRFAKHTGFNVQLRSPTPARKAPADDLSPQRKIKLGPPKLPPGKTMADYKRWLKGDRC